MRGLKGDKMRHYFDTLGRLPMHANLIRMAETMEVPSLGLVTPDEFAALPAFRQPSMSGYGEIHKIGEVNCQTYILPFLKARPLFQCEKSFWTLPGQEGAGLTTAAPNACYTHSGRVDLRGVLYRATACRLNNS